MGHFSPPLRLQLPEVSFVRMLVVLLRLSLQIWEAVLLLVLSCERLSMVCNSLGLWVFGGYRFNQIRWQQLLFLLRNLSWIINIFTAKQIALRIIWPTLVILLCLVFI
ncbi:hypothetical protein LINGRAHAP2_LOCUS28916 [Linum grandiflorum]